MTRVLSKGIRYEVLDADAGGMLLSTTLTVRGLGGLASTGAEVWGGGRTPKFAPDARP